MILRSFVKHTNKEAHRDEDHSGLSVYELESFIALQYAMGLYGKNHPLYFMYNETYGIPTFSETMSQGRFTAFLKYLRFDDKPNRRYTGEGADRFATIGAVFQMFACMCQ